ncbi:MAG: hypothetical protein LBN03_02395 [Bifidobacteriaceae bacterium]|nr:hypothetical protein [Bifidobacteriaceae bacterium]
MKTTVKDNNKTEKLLTVSYAFADVKKELEKVFADIKKDVKIPGFRGGKVPNKIVEQKVGVDYIINQLINETVNRMYVEGLTEQNIKTLAMPKIDITKVPEVNTINANDTAEDFVFEATIAVTPDFELPKIEGLEIKVNDKDLRDPMKDMGAAGAPDDSKNFDSNASVDDVLKERLELISEQFGTLKEAKRASKDGDFLTIDLSAKVDGEEIESANGLSYQIGGGTVALVGGLDENITGLKAGETKEFNSNLESGEKVGQEANVTVKVIDVKEKSAAKIDDELAKNAGFIDLTDMKSKVKENIEKEKVAMFAVAARDKFVKYLIESLDFELPTVALDDIKNQIAEGAQKTVEDYKGEELKQLEEQAKESLFGQIIFDKLVDTFDVKVEPNEIQEHINSTARMYGIDPAQFFQMLIQQNQIQAVATDLLNSKAVISAMRKIVVKNEKGTVVDISEHLVIPGEGEDLPGAEKPKRKTSKPEVKRAKKETPAKDESKAEPKEEKAEKPAKEEKAEKPAKAEPKAEKPAKAEPKAEIKLDDEPPAGALF